MNNEQARQLTESLGQKGIKVSALCHPGPEKETNPQDEIVGLRNALQYEKQWTDHLREMHNQDREELSELRDRIAVAERSIRELAELIEGIKALL